MLRQTNENISNVVISAERCIRNTLRQKYRVFKVEAIDVLTKHCPIKMRRNATHQMQTCQRVVKAFVNSECLYQLVLALMGRNATDEEPVATSVFARFTQFIEEPLVAC